jgi:protein-S-isoprenylcysteine O-methyltransferase Ste14
MASVNPYDPPRTNDRATAKRNPWGRAVVSAILLLLAVCSFLLLNGQSFTNSLWSLGFLAVSTAVWASGGRKHRFLVLVHALLMLALFVSLPRMYVQQRDFNESYERQMEKMRGE